MNKIILQPAGDGVEVLETDCNMITVEEKVAISGDGNCPKSFGEMVRPVGVEPTAH